MPLRYPLALAELDVSGTPSPGSWISFSLSAPRPFAPYVLALSLGTVPGINADVGWIIPLTPDALFTWSRQPNNPWLPHAAGTLDANGVTVIPPQMYVPNVPALVGYGVYACVITLGPAPTYAIGDISPARLILFLQRALNPASRGR